VRAMQIVDKAKAQDKLSTLKVWPLVQPLNSSSMLTKHMSPSIVAHSDLRLVFVFQVHVSVSMN
jgi:hypothetical protein